MGLKVYVFFKVRFSEDHSLYLENHSSYFYQIKNNQSEAIRTDGELNGILPDDELYKRPEETTVTKLCEQTKDEIEEPSGEVKNQEAQKRKTDEEASTSATSMRNEKHPSKKRTSENTKKTLVI